MQPEIINTKPAVIMPQPSGEKIMKVLNRYMEKEKDYETRHETSFRKEYLKEILQEINKIR